MVQDLSAETATGNSLTEMLNGGRLANTNSYHSGTNVEFIGTPAQMAALFGALARASGNFKPIKEDSEGQVGTRKFKYADLDSLITATRQALSGEGIFVLQLLCGPIARLAGEREPELKKDGPEDRKSEFVRETEIHQIRTCVTHADGGMIVSCIDYKRATDIKVWGAQTTYIRRYMYRTALGLDGGDDADATAQGTTERTQRRTEPAQPPPDPKPAARQETRPPPIPQQQTRKSEPPPAQPATPAQPAPQAQPATPVIVSKPQTQLTAQQLKDSVKIEAQRIGMPREAMLSWLYTLCNVPIPQRAQYNFSTDELAFALEEMRKMQPAK